MSNNTLELGVNRYLEQVDSEGEQRLNNLPLKRILQLTGKALAFMHSTNMEGKSKMSTVQLFSYCFYVDFSTFFCVCNVENESDLWEQKVQWLFSWLWKWFISDLFLAPLWQSNFLSFIWTKGLLKYVLTYTFEEI